MYTCMSVVGHSSDYTGLRFTLSDSPSGHAGGSFGEMHGGCQYRPSMRECERSQPRTETRLQVGLVVPCCVPWEQF